MNNTVSYTIISTQLFCFYVIGQNKKQLIPKKYKDVDVIGRKYSFMITNTFLQSNHCQIESFMMYWIVQALYIFVLAELILRFKNKIRNKLGRTTK